MQKELFIMNNCKGQVLVLFVLILPIILMGLVLVIDLGLLYSEDKHIENSIKDALQYGIQNSEDKEVIEKITRLLNENISDIDNIEIKNQENNLKIEVEKKYEGLFRGIFPTNIYNIKNAYYAYINDGELVISKE